MHFLRLLLAVSYAFHQVDQRHPGSNNPQIPSTSDFDISTAKQTPGNSEIIEKEASTGPPLPPNPAVLPEQSADIPAASFKLAETDSSLANSAASVEISDKEAHILVVASSFEPVLPEKNGLSSPSSPDKEEKHSETTEITDTKELQETAADLSSSQLPVLEESAGKKLADIEINKGVNLSSEQPIEAVDLPDSQHDQEKSTSPQVPLAEPPSPSAEEPISLESAEVPPNDTGNAEALIPDQGEMEGILPNTEAEKVSSAVDSVIEEKGKTESSHFEHSSEVPNPIIIPESTVDLQGHGAETSEQTGRDTIGILTPGSTHPNTDFTHEVVTLDTQTTHEEKEATSQSSVPGNQTAPEAPFPTDSEEVPSIPTPVHNPTITEQAGKDTQEVTPEPLPPITIEKTQATPTVEPIPSNPTVLTPEATKQLPQVSKSSEETAVSWEDKAVKEQDKVNLVVEAKPVDTQHKDLSEPHETAIEEKGLNSDKPVEIQAETATNTIGEKEVTSQSSVPVNQPPPTERKEAPSNPVPVHNPTVTDTAVTPEPLPPLAIEKTKPDAPLIPQIPNSSVSPDNTSASQQATSNPSMTVPSSTESLEHSSRVSKNLEESAVTSGETKEAEVKREPKESSEIHEEIVSNPHKHAETEIATDSGTTQASVDSTQTVTSRIQGTEGAADPNTGNEEKEATSQSPTDSKEAPSNPVPVHNPTITETAVTPEPLPPLTIEKTQATPTVEPIPSNPTVITPEATTRLPQASNSPEKAAVTSTESKEAEVMREPKDSSESHEEIVSNPHKPVETEIAADSGSAPLNEITSEASSALDSKEAPSLPTPVVTPSVTDTAVTPEPLPTLAIEKTKPDAPLIPQIPIPHTSYTPPLVEQTTSSLPQPASSPEHSSLASNNTEETIPSAGNQEEGISSGMQEQKDSEEYVSGNKETADKPVEPLTEMPANTGNAGDVTVAPELADISTASNQAAIPDPHIPILPIHEEEQTHSAHMSQAELPPVPIDTAHSHGPEAGTEQPLPVHTSSPPSEEPPMQTSSTSAEPDKDLFETNTGWEESDFPIPIEPFPDSQETIATDSPGDNEDLTGNEGQTEPSIEVIPTPVENTTNGSDIPIWEDIPLTVEKAVGRTYREIRGSDTQFVCGFYLFLLIFALFSCCQPRKTTPKSLETQYQPLTFPLAKPKSVTSSLATLEAHLAEMLQAHLECQREVVDSHTSLCEELRVIA